MSTHRPDSEPLRPIDAASAWRGADLVRRGGKHALTAALLDGARTALASRQEIETLTRADFPLPAIRESLQRWRTAVFDGPGFVLLSGFPLGTASPAEIEAMCFGLGT